MDSRQRRKERRAARETAIVRLEMDKGFAQALSALDIAEYELGLARADAVVVRGERDALIVELRDAREDVARLEGLLENAQAEARTLRNYAITQTEELERRAKELARLRDDDHDAGKLRRRLREKTAEVDNAHRKVSELTQAVNEMRAREPMVIRRTVAVPVTLADEP